MEIHFNCPHCAKRLKGDAGLRGEVIECPDCEEEFTPSAFSSTPILSEADRIRRTAQSFVLAGAFFTIIGVVWLLPAIAGIAPGGLSVTAVCVGIGLWLYLIGQVIHIRANTLK